MYKNNRKSTFLDLDSDCEGEYMAATAAPEATDPAPPSRVSTPTGLPNGLPTYTDNWALWSDVDNAPPCRCCSMMMALGEEGHWFCATSNRKWLMLDEEPDMSRPHSEGVCLGNCCRYHPLMNVEAARWKRGMAIGLSWGDLWAEEDALREAEMTAEEKASREAALKEEEERNKLAAIAAIQARKAERVAVRVGVYRKHAVIQKVQQPCKFLYDCKGTPARPTTRRVTTECWSHEYTDPVTGERVCKHVCDRMHPGEPGWCPEWDGNPSYRPAGFVAPPPAAPGRFADSRGSSRASRQSVRQF